MKDVNKVVCDCCGYVYTEKECPNPVCDYNPNITNEAKAAAVQRQVEEQYWQKINRIRNRAYAGNKR